MKTFSIAPLLGAICASMFPMVPSYAGDYQLNEPSFLSELQSEAPSTGDDNPIAQPTYGEVMNYLIGVRRDRPNRGRFEDAVFRTMTR